MATPRQNRPSWDVFPKLASLFCIVTGCLVLAGWALDIAFLKSVVPGLTPMKGAAALGFILAGAGLWFLRLERSESSAVARRIGQGSAFLAGLLGLLAHSEHIFGWDLGLERRLVPGEAADAESAQAVRMAFATALNFVFLSAALLLLDSRRGQRLARFFCHSVVLISLTALVCYAYGFLSLYALRFFTGMALHAAATFVVLALGILLARPERGWMVILTSDTPGGFVARRLLPAAVAVPIAFGWLRLLGQRAGLYDTEFGLALVVVASIVAFSGLIWWSSRSLYVFDIEQKRLHEALRQSEERFVKAFHSSPVTTGISSLDDGRFVDVNETFVDVSGYTREEALGVTAAELRLWADPAERAGVLQSLLEQGSVRNVEATFCLKSGERRTGLYSAELIEINGRKHVLASAFDVTERKKAEDLLKRSEASLRHAQRIARLGNWEYNVQTKEVHWSDELHSICGVDPREFLPSVEGSLSLVHAEDRECVRRMARQTLFNRESFDLDLRIVWPDSSERILHALAEVTYGKSGEPVWLRGTAQDITERKSMEEALKASAEFTRNIIESSLDMVITTDMERRITRFNKAAQQTFGYAEDEVLGRHVDLLYAEAQQSQTVHQTLLATGRCVQEIRNRRKNSEVFPSFLAASILRDSRGDQMGQIGISRDITETKRLEMQLLKAQRMEEIGRLVSGIAHDLNNILAPILMAAPLLRLEPKPEESEKILNTLETSAQRGAEVVRQLLTFARGAEGTKAVIRPSSAFREIVKMVRETFPKEIEVAFHVPADLWAILGNSTHLYQVLLNLCVNGRDAMSKGGTLSLSAENKHLDEQYAAMTPDAKPGPYVLFRVKDNGTGIPREVLEKIFDPFFSTKEPGRGTGLGLSTVLRIVKGHGGFVQVQSAVGAGTEFQIYLPAAVGAEAPPTATDPLPNQWRGRGELVLAVDDEIQILEIIRKTLEQRGCRVLTAEDGAQGVAAFVQHRDEIKLVLTDIDMPTMGGVAFVAAVRHLSSEVKVVASSGLISDPSRTDWVAELNRLGVQKFLTKPYRGEELVAAVQEALADPP